MPDYDIILVRAPDPSGVVGIWERHPAHPGGEVYVHGRQVVRAAATPRVRRALARGRLVEVRTRTPSSMPDPRKFAHMALTDLNGLGPATAAKFAAYGIRTVQDLVDANADDLADVASRDRIQGWLDEIGA